MKQEKLLSELYKKYRGGELGRRDLECGIFQYLLDNYERYNVFPGDRDKWEEFLSWAYLRLTRSIDLYREMGSSFDAYIASLVHFASKEYRCREEDHRITEYTCWTAKARESEDMKVYESEEEYSEGPKEIFIPKGVKRQQILFLLLKTYHFVNDDIINRSAPLIGMDSEVICFLIEKVKILRSVNDDEIYNLREKVHGQYYRCLAYQRRMDMTLPGTMYHEKMRGRFERAQKRYTAMKKRFGRMRMTASNRMIANVLGVPKGTVDTGLSTIKKRFGSSTREAA